jgi:hypothetical protein
MLSKKTLEDLENFKKESIVLFENIKKGHIELPRAAELNNTTGKYLGICKVELANQALDREIQQQQRQLETFNKR